MRILAYSALLTALAAPLSAAELPFTQVYGNEFGCLSADALSASKCNDCYRKLTATGQEWWLMGCNFLTVLPVNAESVELRRNGWLYPYVVVGVNISQQWI